MLCTDCVFASGFCSISHWHFELWFVSFCMVKLKRNENRWSEWKLIYKHRRKLFLVNHRHCAQVKAIDWCDVCWWQWHWKIHFPIYLSAIIMKNAAFFHGCTWDWLIQQFFTTKRKISEKQRKNIVSYTEVTLFDIVSSRTPRHKAFYIPSSITGNRSKKGNWPTDQRTLHKISWL